jgi:hypothetical protein
MSRPLIATVAALLFMMVYVIAAISLPDELPPMPGLVAPLYWCVAGLLWVLPVRWLMLWGAGQR